MAIGLGRNTAIGTGEESAWGTAVARDTWFRATSFGLLREVPKADRGVLAEGGIVTAAHFVQADNAGGPLSFPAYYENMGRWYKHLLWGTPSTTGPSGGLYTHTYPIGNTPPTGGLTIEGYRGTLASASSEVFEGCRLNRGVFSIDAGGRGLWEFDVIAETSGGRTSGGSPSFPSAEPMVMHYEAGTVGWNSNTYTPKSLRVTINRNLQRNQVLGSKLTTDPPPSGFTEITIDLEIQWQTDTLVTALTADTIADLAITFTQAGTSYTLTFTLHNAYVTRASDPITGVGIVTQSVTLKAARDSSDTGLVITAVNSQSSAT